MARRKKRNWKSGSFKPVAGRSSTNERRAVVRGAGKFFSLLDERLRVGTEGYSPRLLQKIEYSGANEESFQEAAKELKVLAELSISAKHVQRITERLGAERQQQRDAEVAAFQAGVLKPQYPEPPQVVAVHLDAGKIQLRQESGEPGVHEPHWGDSKVGCFLTYTALSGDSDPQPHPPLVFLDPPRVMRLCREMERVRNQPQTSPSGPEAPLLSLVTEEHPEVDRPERLVRTAVATMGSVEPFGWMVAAEAMKRGFYEAQRQAVLGDGGNWISPLAELHFPGWTQILDFLHLLVHLYAAATAAYRGQAQAAWGCYERWVRSAWAGRVDEVIAGLQVESMRLGQPPPKAADNDPRRIVSLTLDYVKTNAERMDYASYRRAGLPISSAPVESLIKQFNQRVKGTEKFWLLGGVESILQVRAACLSEDDRAERFHDHRPRGRAVGRNRLRPAA
jgi:hypothetical protein